MGNKNDHGTTKQTVKRNIKPYGVPTDPHYLDTILPDQSNHNLKAPYKHM